jgi:pimeloyl-ACP methyl ester carboxylesterase
VLFVRAFLDKLGLERVVLGGNSLGGQIAWAAAAKLPDRVERLILVDASGYPPETIAGGQSVPIGFRIMTVPGLRLVAEHTLPRGVVESSVRNVYADPSKVTPALVDLYADMARREGNRRALARRLEQGYTGDVTQLAKIKAPTLILWGAQDHLLPPELAQRFAHDIPNSKLVMLDGLGHVPQEEDPARSVAEVRRFLAP